MSLGANRTTLKLSTANVILLANAFVWYLLAFNTLKQLLGEGSPYELLIIGVNTGAIALSGLLGSLLADKLKKRDTFLYLWLASGVVLSLIPLALNVTNLNDLTLISLVFGLYFGLGMPATMGYHSTVTAVENRAKLGGLAFLIIGIIFAGTTLISVVNLLEICIILALIRLTGLLIFHVTPKQKDQQKVTSKPKYSKILANKSFILYFVPWLMFTLVNFMTIPIQGKIGEMVSNRALFAAIESIIIALVAVISGFVADKWGRKRLTIVGFIMLGIGYAVIGLSPDLTGSLVYIISDGVAWGIFYVLFLFTLWGDLSQSGRSDKFYFLGALPYVSSYFMQTLFSGYIKGIEPTTMFSFASVFLFLAVLPLIYAPETLPEKLMKDRDLKSYIEKAKKRAQKESHKSHKSEVPPQNIQVKEEIEAKSTVEYEDAAKLAEKYY